MIITAVISITPYLADKGEHTVPYKINNNVCIKTSKIIHYMVMILYICIILICLFWQVCMIYVSARQTRSLLFWLDGLYRVFQLCPCSRKEKWPRRTRLKTMLTKMAFPTRPITPRLDLDKVTDWPARTHARTPPPPPHTHTHTHVAQTQTLTWHPYLHITHQIPDLFLVVRREWPFWLTGDKISGVN